MRTTTLSSLVILAVTGSLLLSCADEKDKKNKVAPVSHTKPADANTETTEVAAEKPEAELVYENEGVEDEASLTIRLNLKNSKGEIESLTSTRARKTVLSDGAGGYDYFRGDGEIRRAALLRNDAAQLSVAFVVTTQEASDALDDEHTSALTHEAFDSIYIFEQGPADKLGGTFTAKLKLVDLGLAAESVGVDVDSFVAAVRTAIIETTTKTSAEELVTSVKKQFQEVQSSEVEEEDDEAAADEVDTDLTQEGDESSEAGDHDVDTTQE